MTDPIAEAEMCVAGHPTFASAVEVFNGCGPPVRAGDKVYLLDSRLGFVGLSGKTTGPHLHLGLRVKSYNGSWPFINICTLEWLQGRAVGAETYCYTDMADPLAFLPQAPGVSPAQGVGARLLAAGDVTPTAIIPEGAPYQLPPPNYPGSLMFEPQPSAEPVGQYWSPYADGGQYGGGSIGEWFCSEVWGGFPWCS